MLLFSRRIFMETVLSLFLVCLVSATETNPKRDSILLEKLLHTDLILKTDSLPLEQLPLKGAYQTIYKGDRVIVAEITCEKEKIRLKIARDQETQGWIPLNQLYSFAPASLLSQLTWIMEYSSLAKPFILLFIIILITGKIVRKKDSPIPILADTIPFAFPAFIGNHALIILTLQGIKHFCPDQWHLFYLDPLINPLSASFPFSFLIAEIWLAVILFLTMLEQAFRHYTAEKALLWVTHLSACSLFLYILFIPTPYYTSILLLIFPGYNLLKRITTEKKYRYRCGKCNGKMEHTGTCPHCGILNS